jgi:hypothetical protein
MKKNIQKDDLFERRIYVKEFMGKNLCERIYVKEFIAKTPLLKKRIY